MADDPTPPYALGRLILDYLRALLWPTVVLVLVLVYQDDVRTILQEREVDIFGLRIGERVAQIESQAMAEIEDIRLLLNERQAAAQGGEATANLSADIEAKLDALARNLSREIAQVQATTPAPPEADPGPPPQTTPSRGERAAAAERRGFEALIERDLEAALDAFDEARRIWPEYHNVYEIGRLLRQRRDELQAASAQAWPQLYRDILTDYSWGMPQDLRATLRAEAAAY